MSVGTSSPSSALGTGLLGSTTPRLWTPPLVEGPPGPCGCGCALTPDTSYGFDVVEFADDLGVVTFEDGRRWSAELDPWQRWLVIHGGELLEDGRPRFRKLLVVVARQNGKTHVLIVLGLWWQFVRRYPLLLGTSTKLEYAREPWAVACEVVKASPKLSRFRARDRSGGIRTENGSAHLKSSDGCRYLIAPAARRGGRSLSIDRLILDELREHTSYMAWDAAVLAQNALSDAQAWAISNMGDASSVVLNDQLDEAERSIETGDGDPRTGAFLWTNEAGADVTDLEVLATSNPNLGRRLEAGVLLADANASVRIGGEKLTGFQTEVACIRIKALNPAVDARMWSECLDPGDLLAVRSRVALCLDVAPDEQHATIVAAAVLPDDRVRVEVVGAWSGPGCREDLRRELLPLVQRIRPNGLGWFPGGPGAALAAELAPADRGARPGPLQRALRRAPEAIQAETPAVCMGLAQLIQASKVAHSGDALLTDHVTGAEKLPRGERWVFSRSADRHCDAAYAAAGAVHLARTLPAPVGRPRVIVADRS